MTTMRFFQPAVAFAICGLLSASISQAKECYRTVTLLVVSEHGEQFILRPPPDTQGYGTNWDFGTIQLSAGAYVRVFNAKLGTGCDCSASIQRDGVNLSLSSDWNCNLSVDCSIAGSYSGGAAGDIAWGPTTYQFTIAADASTTPVLQELRVGCVLKGTVAPESSTMVRNLLSVPCTEPYTALGYPPSNNGSETVDGCAALFNQTQVVDWVHVDLLAPYPPYDPVVSLNGLLHTDHWITSTDGISPLAFEAPPGNYRVRISHRNHLPIISDWAIPFTGAAMDVSFHQSPWLAMMLPVLPPSCSGDVSGMMIPGNANGSPHISYVGPNNDRDPMLVRVGGSIPTNVANGYYLEDINMDGAVKYVGQNNDRDLILQTIGGSVPTNVVVGQTP